MLLVYVERPSCTTTSDEKRTVELYTSAADQGHAVAQFNLGCMYKHGQGVDKDEKHAVELYTLAADNTLIVVHK